MWGGVSMAVLLMLSAGGIEAHSTNATEARIVELSPNPPEYMDHGEYIVVEVPHPTRLVNWSFVDDDGQRAKPPPVTVNGTVVFSLDPPLVEPLVPYRVVPLEGWLRLADAGETISLVVDGREVDRVSYAGPAPRAKRWLRDERRWAPLGATEFAPVTVTGRGTVYVLPDAPEVAIDAVRGARDRLYLGGYTLSEPAVVEALLEQHRAGVDVRVHVEGRPVGGISASMGEALDALVEAGIPVTVHRGPYARWGYHHAKYAVVDDRLLVMTENWKPSGVGGRSNRGWGVVVNDPELAARASEVFAADASWMDALDWADVRDRIDRHRGEPASREFPGRHGPAAFDRVDATLLVAPDNAEEALRRVLEDASTSIDIVQVRIADVDFPLMRETVEAARRGVRVRILLSGSWEVVDENRRLAASLTDIAEREGLDLSVRVVEPGAAFNRIHAKGIIVDEETVVVSSINWNNHSLRENREVALVLHDRAVGTYFTAVFEADWPGSPTWRLPLGLVAVAILAAGLVARHARGLHLEGSEATADERYTDEGRNG